MSFNTPFLEETTVEVEDEQLYISPKYTVPPIGGIIPPIGQTRELEPKLLVSSRRGLKGVHRCIPRGQGFKMV